MDNIVFDRLQQAVNSGNFDEAVSYLDTLSGRVAAHITNKLEENKAKKTFLKYLENLHK